MEVLLVGGLGISEGEKILTTMWAFVRYIYLSTDGKGYGGGRKHLYYGGKAGRLLPDYLQVCGRLYDISYSSICLVF
jgi:hypothetical protein